MKLKRVGFHFIIINLIRLLLIVEFFIALNQERDLVLFASVIGFIVTFVPKILNKYFGIHTGKAIEILIVMFIFGLLFLKEVRDLSSSLWYDILLNFVAVFALGLVGLSILYALYKSGVLNSSPIVISFLVFCFTLSFATLWQIFGFVLDSLFGFTLQQSGVDAMRNMAVNFLGALFVSFIGYFYVKHKEYNLISKFLMKLIGKNIKHLKSKETLERSEEEIKEIIRKGESEKLEFKSTLRTNLHTGLRDRKIEYNVLKTLVAFLNSDGGTLFVGVGDKGEIQGLEKDGFQDNDALKLHLTNLLKQHIGSHYLPFIDFELFPVEDKHVLKIDCTRSDKRVFLKVDKEEEFYIRNGPSSVRLNGNSLIEYIEHRF